MPFSNWIWTNEQDRSTNEALAVEGLLRFGGQVDIPLAVFTGTGYLLAFNLSFQMIFKEDNKWQDLFKKEIFMMKSLNKSWVTFELTVFDGALEKQLEILITMQPAGEDQVYVCKVEDVTEDKVTESRILDMNYQLTQKIKEINEAQIKIMNQEKLVGIGQLAAGVAHEINNPLGFVKSNFRVLDDYFREITKLLISIKDEFCTFKDNLKDEVESTPIQDFLDRVENAIDESDYKYIIEDYEGLFKDTSIGLERVEKIVMSLRKFSRVDHMMTFTEYNLNEGIDETLIIANNEIKYSAEVIKDMQYVPLTYAIAGEINQVLLNILINATHAIKEKGKNHKGIIKITTRSDEKYIYCEIMDNGIGIKARDQDQIFVPFFTTKEVGNGTGLGMSIAYDIITNKHSGEINFISEYGMGTTFKIKLPIRKVDTDTVDSFVNI